MTLSPEDVQALKALCQALGELGWAFVIVGARVPWILTTEGRDPRVTRDLDAVVGAATWDDFERLADRLRALGFARREAHKFVSPDGAEVDLIPFGPGTVRDDQLVWPDGTVMSALGLSEAPATAVERDVARDLRVPVVSEPVFALLKIVAYTDRSRARIRDLVDLVAAFGRYEEDSDRRFELVDVSVDAEPVEFEVAGAYLLGQDAAARARPNTRAVVGEFLERFDDEYAAPVSQILLAERRLHSDERSMRCGGCSGASGPALDCAEASAECTRSSI